MEKPTSLEELAKKIRSEGALKKPTAKVQKKEQLAEDKKEKIVVNSYTGQILMKTICIGITFYPKDGEDLDTIIRKSDIALREAKNRGRSEYFIFSEQETSKIELF